MTTIETDPIFRGGDLTETETARYRNRFDSTIAILVESRLGTVKKMALSNFRRKKLRDRARQEPMVGHNNGHVCRTTAQRCLSVKEFSELKNIERCDHR